MRHQPSSPSPKVRMPREAVSIHTYQVMDVPPSAVMSMVYSPVPMFSATLLYFGFGSIQKVTISPSYSMVLGTLMYCSPSYGHSTVSLSR